MPGWTKEAEEARKPKRRARYQADPEFRAAKIAAALAYAKANPDRRLNAHLIRSYGISLDQFREMELAQDGRCAICREPETHRHRTSGEVLRLSVDHCHVTGKVRGLLCRKCNHTLGLWNDDPDRFESAAAYLRRDFPEVAADA
jgi:hypothetical protein